MPEGREDPPTRGDRYWDAVVQGQRPDAAIDPALAAAIAWVHALDDAPAPDPGFVARLERDLVPAAPRTSTASVVAAPSLTTVRNGTAPHHPLRSPVLRLRRPRRWAAHLTTAALVVLTLVAAFAALRLRPDADRDPGMDPAPGDWSSTLLLRASLDTLPAGSVGVQLDRWTFPPGPGEWPGVAPSLPALLYVEEGRLSATVDARATLSRATAVKGEAVAVPAGHEVGLPAGDLLVVPAGARFALGTDGSAPPVVLVVSLTPTAEQGGAASVPPGVAAQALASGTLTGVPNGPGSLLLRRLAVAPRTVLPPETAAGPELLVVEAGTAGLRKGPDTPEVTLAASGDASTVVPAGAVLALRNPGDEPLALLRVTVAASAVDTGSPTPWRRPRSDPAGDPARPEAPAVRDA